MIKYHQINYYKQDIKKHLGNALFSKNKIHNEACKSIYAKGCCPNDRDILLRCKLLKVLFLLFLDALSVSRNLCIFRYRACLGNYFIY